VERVETLEAQQRGTDSAQPVQSAQAVAGGALRAGACLGPRAGILHRPRWADHAGQQAGGERLGEESPRNSARSVPLVAVRRHLRLHERADLVPVRPVRGSVVRTGARRRRSVNAKRESDGQTHDARLLCLPYHDGLAQFRPSLSGCAFTGIAGRRGQRQCRGESPANSPRKASDTAGARGHAGFALHRMYVHLLRYPRPIYCRASRPYLYTVRRGSVCSAYGFIILL